MGDVPDISVIRANMGFQLKKGDMKRMEGMRQQELFIVVSCRPMCLPNAGRCGEVGSPPSSSRQSFPIGNVLYGPSDVFGERVSDCFHLNINECQGLDQTFFRFTLEKSSS